MARLFLELDVDGSNSISAAEMAAATSRFGGQLTPAQMQKLAEKLALMDADGDKTVSFAGERVVALSRAAVPWLQVRRCYDLRTL
jgi:Ca2+-binding EF-hand superfamily protein